MRTRRRPGTSSSSPPARRWAGRTGPGRSSTRSTPGSPTPRPAHPAFAGKVLVEDYGPENGGHYLIGKGDPRRALFDALGFDAQETTGDVSEEQLSLLDRDILFVNGATAQQMVASPVFSRLAVVRDGRTLYTTFDSPLSGALSYSGPDALLYALDVLVPQLANAVEGRPVADLSNA